MVWSQVDHEVTRPHVAYAVTGFALVLFGTISLFVKEKLYLGEATLATIYGLIVGPHCLDWFSPVTWGNTDYITLEISKIVLIIQIFAVAVELPKKYMLKHWFSVTLLLLPVMTYGWLVTSVFIWKLVPSLRWIHALCISGCVTATDPVLASAVVGKGKFAQRVPGHLRNLLSAESGCNDGMAFPFVIMAVYIILDEYHAGDIAKEFICIGILYECILGILIGAVIGYGARHLIKFAEKMGFIDRESFLAYYFCVAMFCAGVGTLCGVDDLLVAFAAGAAFSWDGWFAKETEESHVSNVIDTLLNTAFFVYFGAIVPWPDFNNAEIGLSAWKLVCLALIVLVVRRIPIMLAIKPITPDIHTWREAMFCGHFGPIGVGAIFMSLLARAQLETGSEIPSPELPGAENVNHYLLETIWPITCFLVIASIVVHGSSIAVFTLGKRINNMAITLTYTTTGNTAGGQPSWLARLPQRAGDGRNPLELKRVETEDPISRRFRKKSKTAKKVPEDAGFDNSGDHSVNVEHDISGVPKRKSLPDEDKPDTEDKEAPTTLDLSLRVNLSGEDEPIEIVSPVAASKLKGKELSDINTYREGDHIVVEDSQGNLIHSFNIGQSQGEIVGEPQLEIIAPTRHASYPSSSSDSPDSKEEDLDGDYSVQSKAYAGQRPRRRSLPRLHRPRSRVPASGGVKAFACIMDDTVVVENEDGEILRRYKFVPRGGEKHARPNLPSANQCKSWSEMVPDFIKNKFKPRHKGDDFKDVEKAPENMLVPDRDGPPLSTAASMALSENDERLIQRNLSNMLRTGTIERRPSRALQLRPGDARPQTMRSQVVTSDDDADDESPVIDDDEEEPETSVERHRRLAALGVIDTGEENTAAQENGDDDEPKITFQLPKRPH